MRRSTTLRLLLILLLPAVALVACTEGEGTPTPTLTVAPTAAATAATPTPIASPPPAPQAMLSGKMKVDEPRIVVTEDGEELRVSLSDEGAVWHFKPGDGWMVSRADGTVLFSGTIVEEALQWEQVTGFVRLDDGRPVAYNLDIDGNWRVYPAEEMCRLAAYYVRQLEGSGSVVLQGFEDVADICREKLGITEGIPETP